MQRPAGSHWIPDFCNAQSLVIVTLVAGALSLLVSLADRSDRAFFERLVPTLLFVEWLAFTLAALACVSRDWLIKRSTRVASMVLMVIALATTALFSALLPWIDQMLALGMTVPGRIASVEFLWANILMMAVVVAVALRYFWLQHAFRAQLEAEAQSRIAALQARIRPHFLFNSLNTAIALVRLAPERAEMLLEDLAELFRAALREHDASWTIGEELALVRQYLRIEAERLGDRLQIDEQIDDQALTIAIPPLLLQPLVENAVYHGVSQCVDGGQLRLQIWREGEQLWIAIGNPMPHRRVDQGSRGQGMAQQNIRERLALFTGGRGQLELVAGPSEYRATVRMPWRPAGPAAQNVVQSSLRGP